MLGLCGAPLRFQAFLLDFGKIENQPGENDMVTNPIPGRRPHIARTIRVSAATLNKLFVMLLNPNLYERSGEFIRFKASVLQEAHE